MHNAQADGLLFPSPRFSDAFRSYFDEETDLEIGSNIVSFSPLTRNVSKFIKRTKIDGRDVRELNLKAYREHLLRYGRDDKEDVKQQIFYPSRDVPETSWNNLCLLEVDFCLRNDGMTALLWAAHRGDIDGMKRLLSSGANVNKQLKNGNTVLMETIAGNMGTRHACVNILLDHGVRINLQNQVGHTAFTAATSVGDLQIVESICVQYKQEINFNHKTKQGSSALMLAIAGNHKEIVQCLLNHNIDLLQEDKNQLTALCWAQALNPSFAGMLGCKLNSHNLLPAYIKKRNEALNTKKDNFVEYFGGIYQILPLLLNFSSCRRALIKEGALHKLTSDDVWEKMHCPGAGGQQQRGFYQIHPWFVALSCAMMCDENYPVQAFTTSFAGKKYLLEINHSLRTIAKSEIFMAHALMIPLLAQEIGRQFIIEQGFKEENILNMFIDRDGVSESSSVVMQRFTEHLNDQLDQYDLKHWNQIYGEEKQVKKRGNKSASQRLREAYGFFEVLQEKARQLEADLKRKEIEEKIARQAEAIELEQSRQRKTNRRERRRQSFENERQNAAIQGQKMERDMKRCDKKESKGSKSATVSLNDLDFKVFKASTVKSSTQKSAFEASTPYKSSVKPKVTNKYGIETVINDRNDREGARLKQATTENQNQPSDNVTILTPSKHSASSSAKQQSPSQSKQSVASPTKHSAVSSAKQKVSSPAKQQLASPQKQLVDSPSIHSEASPAKQPKQPPVSSTSKPTSNAQKPNHKPLPTASLSKHSEASSAKHQLPPPIKQPTRPPVSSASKPTSNAPKPNHKLLPTPSRSAKLTDEEIAKQQQEDNDFLMAWELQNNCDMGFDVVEERKTETRTTANGSENTKLKSSSLTVPKFPSLPRNAVEAADLEYQSKASAEVTKSDQACALGFEANYVEKAKVEPSKTSKKWFDFSQSAGDGPEQPWVQRSTRWKETLKKLYDLPPESKQRMGTTQFTFDDESLIIGKGLKAVVTVGIRDDGTEVAVKRVRKDGHAEHIRNEYHSLLYLDKFVNSNIVKYKDYHEDNSFCYLFMELCEHTLDEYIDLLGEQKVKAQSQRLVTELFQSLTTLQEARVLHRDLKPKHILIDVRGTIKLAGFDVSLMLRPRENVYNEELVVGAQCWRSREVLDALEAGCPVPYSFSSDIQVAGMIAYYIARGVHPYGDNPHECECNIKNSNPARVLSEQDHFLVAMMAGSLPHEPSRRRPARELLRYPYFWSTDRKFEFLVRFNNITEIQMQITCDVTTNLKAAGQFTETDNWMNKVNPFHLQSMHYQGFHYTNSVLDLIQFIVDTDEDFSTLPYHVQAVMDNPREYLINNYHKLFVAVYEVVKECGWKDRRELADFFYG